VDDSNRDAGITRTAADWHREGVADKGLEIFFSTNIHQVFAAITANLQQKGFH